MDTLTWMWLLPPVALFLAFWGHFMASPRQKWRDEQLRLGRRPADVADEEAVRMALAELVRIVSESALGDGHWRVMLECVLERQSAALTRRSPRLGKRYLDMVAALDDSDILWPEAYKVAFPPGPEPEPIEFTLEQLELPRKWLKEDEHAAFGK